MRKIRLPLEDEDRQSLKSGDHVELSGQLYIMRDAAQDRLRRMIDAHEDLPIDLKNAIVFYAGPAPLLPDGSVNSIGPTTSKRMDEYLPLLAGLGVAATLGKGDRSLSALKTMNDNGMLYMVTVGGAAALMSRFFKSIEVVAFEDLGPESIFRAEVSDLPVFVAFDINGQDLFCEAWSEWRIN